MGSVSIVIIGRNEERDIERCIRAAQKAAAQIGGAEIIYVDSASTDATVKIAEMLGARVVALKPDWELSPSAGRYIGTRAASGEYVLFLDADTLVYTDFLAAAIERFEENSALAGVNGWLDDTDEAGVLLADVEERYEKAVDVKWLRGPACFYRRAALLEVGSFHPFVKVEEEAELGLRLLKNGWRLQIIPVSMACHTRCYHLQTAESVIHNLRRDIVTRRLGEVTNTIAYAFREGYGWSFCWLRLKTTIIFLVWAIVSVAVLFLPEAFYPKTIFISLLIAGAGAIILKKRSLFQAGAFALSKIVNILDVLTGVHRIRIRNSDLYPLDVIEKS